ncbi:energy transducer TonB [Nitrosomonas sp. Is37]|uniref:energy transducer TonB n=1 Tax=Nitrosomonas sp. Is37 TaxID=3080535 RepID=UPI00294B4E80|nr:energy transducer TonB [Nitrosomonas sp. Is37]MDV6344657.1 energy transducer TonB [Nitrosomonas sp. Is37]
MEINKFFQHLAGSVSMLFGLILVFGLIWWMNRYVGQVEKEPAQEVTEISMANQIKPEPQKEVRKVETKKQMTNRPQAPAPFKGLGTGLSGIDLGLLGLDDGQMSDLDDSLIGKTNPGNTVMTDDLVDVPPKPISRGAFKYPPAAKKNGIKGYVVLSVLIGTDGSVDQVQVLESNPSGVFDAAALQGIRSWQFEPGKYKGEIVKVWAKQKIRFDLS